MEKPMYLIVEAPGAYIAEIGFLVPGQYFETPSEGYQPSRTFRALNEPAAAKLKELKEALLAKAKDYRVRSANQSLTSKRREAYDDASDHIEQEAEAMDIAIAGKPGPVVKPDVTMSLKSMDQQERGVKKSSDKRVADR
jgi:hypothetical protein